MGCKGSWGAPVLADSEVGGAHVGAGHDHIVVEHEGFEVADANNFLSAGREDHFQDLAEHGSVVERNAHGLLGPVAGGGLAPGSSVGEKDVG